ncbi:hypothetical protein AUP07_1443 [methanogenic archaeon mixed culture ISO4-G1]|nr:hypothetical protein AUP07_1443 [methanogenic archaeon mixed culture ISO4-G1]
MSPVVQPMTFDDLCQIYREEMKGKTLTTCRPDLYRAMADLLNSLRQEYDRQIAIDPDSVMSEGANLRRKKAETVSKSIISLRTRKTCNKAVLAAEGATEDLSIFTPEERELYLQVVEMSKKHMLVVDRYRGKRVDTHIDEPVRQKEPEKVPEVVEEEPVEEFVPVEEEPFEEPIIEESFDDVPEVTEEDMQEPTSEPEIVEAPETPKLENMVLRILEDLPPFVGPDRNYELHKEDIVTLPTPMAMALINSQKAVSISPVH